MCCFRGELSGDWIAKSHKSDMSLPRHSLSSSWVWALTFNIKLLPGLLFQVHRLLRPFLELHHSNLPHWSQNTVWHPAGQLHILKRNESPKNQLEGFHPLLASLETDEWSMTAGLLIIFNLHVTGCPLGRDGSFVYEILELLPTYLKLVSFFLKPPGWYSHRDLGVGKAPSSLLLFFHISINPSPLIFFKCNHKGTT